MKSILCLTLMMAPAVAIQCAGPNPWLNPATKETGACLSNNNGLSYAWHCPWESGGLVVGFGCAAVKYDCAAPIDQLLTWYETHISSGNTFDATPAEEGYTVRCIKFQCRGGPNPGPKYDPTGAVPVAAAAAVAAVKDGDCNPSKCASGLTCKSNPNECGPMGDWTFCGAKSNRLYCPYGGGPNYFRVMCNDGSCMKTSSACASLGGTKYRFEQCAAPARLLVSV